MRKVRSIGDKLVLRNYIDYVTLLNAMRNVAQENSDIANVIHLTPRTANNRTILALELHSDKQSKKPGILIIGCESINLY